MPKNPSATPYHHGNLRPALLKAAFSLLDQSGVENVTIRAVARQIGVAHSAPANHFKDRKALLTAMATMVFDEIGGAITQQLAKSRSDDTSLTRRARIGVFAETLINFGLSQPHRYRLLWRRDLLDDGDEALQNAMNAIYDALLVELGETRPTRSIETDAIALWSMLHGYISMRLDGNLVAKSDEKAGIPRHHAIVDALFAGIEKAS
jgi:AcrR family transcriptional regulator